MKGDILFDLAVGALLCPVSAALAASAVSEPVAWEDFVNQDIQLDDTVLFAPINDRQVWIDKFKEKIKVIFDDAAFALL